MKLRSPGKGCADRGIAGYKSYGQIREREGGGKSSSINLFIDF